MISEKEASLETLKDIRNIMERSARFLSLSGWSGVWAGAVALAGAAIASSWITNLPYDVDAEDSYTLAMMKFVVLAIGVFVVALIGAFYFTWRKTRAQGGNLWNSASKRMMLHMAIPLLAGGFFSAMFLYNGHDMYIAPACLMFYGLALINGSTYTVTDIKYMGLLEIGLGCISLFWLGYGLLFWTIGFGILHILYGIIMWNKYDRKTTD
ncbi:MAG: hypothetical protein EOP56_12550 [Sphingobacteriales bacterium]|nr:MAG: hypothetical protein EOP56_12550 [Sphingobacteriales bacterium]